MKTHADQAPVTTVGIDTGKNTLHLIGLDQEGRIVLKQKMRARDSRAQGPALPASIPT